MRRQITKGLLELLPQYHFELSICFVSTSEITRLNQTFLQHAGPTDVITFDYSDPSRPQHLSGDIVICMEQAISQARRFRTAWQSELVRYIIHGLLHLMGYDHETDAEAEEMEAIERAALGRLAIPDPYA